ncbi:MAG: FtsX-like permease family protein [Caldilineaceae bacterium]|nr:FtsX-like permease family protein [Caldilineaceae bacterium]
MPPQIANYTMIGLLIAVGLILLYLVFVGIRNPVLVKIGLRNIPRRPSQSILIIIGLTLSTVIILSALATGDTLTYSVRSSAVQAYGRIDEIIAPPLISLLATLGDEGQSIEEAAVENEQVADLTRLTEGGLTSLLAVLEGGLPGITTERLDQLKLEAAEEPLVDAVAGSIIFPTIIRNSTTGQGEPFGFIFAVDNDYDQLFGLTSVDGQPVEMESLQTGVGNIFAQASNLFSLIGQAGNSLGLEGISISDVALATAAVGAALTGNAGADGVDLADLSLDLKTLQGLGIDTTFLEAQGLTEISLESLGITPDLLSDIGVTTTTITLEDVGINTSAVQTTTNQLLSALNLNTLGRELDAVLAQAGLQLRQGDVYLSRLGAQQLDARVGDVLEVYIGPLPLPFRVKAIVDQAGPLSAVAPVVMLRLDETQKLLFMNGRVNNILVSNQGDEIEGIDHTQAVSERLRVLALDPVLVERVAEILRRPQVREILAANVDSFAREFNQEYDGPEFLRPMIESFAGFSSNQALAEELVAELNQPEATPRLRELLSDMNLRSWLSDQTLPENDQAQLDAALTRLNQFDLLDPLSKQTVVSAAEIGGVVFSTIFSVFGILSIVAGVLLIFLIFVMMAAERRSEMGTARAIGVQRVHIVQMFVTEGVVYDLLAAALGVGLGLLISYAMVGFIGNLFNTAAEQLIGQGDIFQVRFRAAPTSIVIAYCLGVLFTFVVVTLSAWRVSRLNIVAAIRDLDEPPGRGRTSRLGRTGRLLFGPILAILGGVLVYYGRDSIGLLQAAASLIIAGIAYLLGWFLEERNMRGERVQRVVYTIIGLGLIAIWAVPWARWIAGLEGRTGISDIWYLLNFVLGAPLLILGAILVVMFNADTLSWAISRLVGGIGFLTPVLRTAIAYPLSSRFRTGMAMVLFAMIITTVTLMTVVIQATQTLVTPDSERYAGFEIGVYNGILSFFDPLEDLEAEIPNKPDFPAQDVAAVGSVATLDANARQVTPAIGADEVNRRASVAGVNNGYLTQAEQVYSFSRRAEGFATDAEVWEALRTRNDVAVLTAGMLRASSGEPSEPPPAEALPEDAAPDEGNLEEGFGPPEERRSPLRVVIADDSSDILPEITITLQSGEQVTQTLQVIGVIEQDTTLAGQDIWVNRDTLTQIAGEPVNPNEFYLKVVEGADVRAVAQATERAFLNNAVNATVLAESFAQAQALTRGILQLFQGFLALGLLVGIAALGVISTRTVVERRQQVGMLRAIGFQPFMVALTFLLESSFIALTGIVVGAAVGILLGEALIGSSLDTVAGGRVFNLPWGQIGVIVLIAYGFSLLTTILPALQASRIYPAEALRYE